MNALTKKWAIRSAVVLAVGALGALAWLRYEGKNDLDGLAGGNGRIEAVEIDIAAKTAGRVKDILVKEGDFVTTGQILAQMDTDVLEAQRRQAEAQLKQTESAIAIAQSQLLQRQAEKSAAVAMLAQRQAELDIARKRQTRTSRLASQGASSQQQADDDEARVKGAFAAVSAAQAQIAAADAAIITARAQLSGAASTTDAARASIERLEADIADSTLKAPRDGRIQYRVAQPGEVIGSGGRVLNMIDLTDVYMTFFLPTASAGKIALGSEVHLVLDAAPQYVIPARVTFISDVAQFTPKTVETAVEREKLMFRLRANIAPELLRKHILQVKTGLPGMAYVRLDPQTPWPANLEVALPQ